jgi:hypothetical protein
VDENIAIEMKFKGNETYLTELLNHDMVGCALACHDGMTQVVHSSAQGLSCRAWSPGTAAGS